MVATYRCSSSWRIPVRLCSGARFQVILMLVSVMVTVSSSGWQRLAKVGAVKDRTRRVAGCPHVCATRSNRNRKSSPFDSSSWVLFSLLL